MKERCSLCHQECVPIDVHGHTQCDRCGQNYNPCCQGEMANESSKQTEGTTRREGDTVSYTHLTLPTKA